MSEHDEPERDELPEDLRRLYASLRPPPLADDAAEADPETARTVQWMRDAWHGLEIPPARVPRLAQRARPLRLVRFALGAAAAGLLVAGGAALWRGLAGAPRPAPTPRVVEGPADASRVEVLAALPDRIELRSGPVRLVLLTPPITEPFDPSGS